MTPKGPAGAETGRRRQTVEGRKDQLGAAELRAAEDGCGNGEGPVAPNVIAAVASSGSPVETTAADSSTFKGQPPWPAASKPAYAALDLGTNNCRLLVARPSRRGFKVIDAFSRIIRLGEGVSSSGRLSEAAIERTIEALQVCAGKIRRHRVERAGLIATEACRLAANAPEFLERARGETGLDIQIVDRETEAKLAVSGCASLIDFACDFALVFDIGGGSSELIWLDLSRHKHLWRRALAERLEVQRCITAWTSLPVGVVTLAERFGGRFVNRDMFDAMVGHVVDMLAPFEAEHGLRH